MAISPQLRALILSLYKQGYSVNEIAKMLNLSYHTVYHVVNYKTKERKLPIHVEFYNQVKALGLDKKLKELLLKTIDRKGKVYRISYRDVQRLFFSLSEVQDANLPRLGKTKWYEFINLFIKSEFGSKEKYLSLIDPKHTSFKPLPKGFIERETALVEIDGTDITIGGKQYSVILAVDLFSGFILGFRATLRKEKGGTTDKNAFSSLDIAEFLFELFSTYGVPRKIKTDNAKNLTARYLEKVINKLNIEQVKRKAYKPWQALIERINKDVKAYQFIYEGEQIDDFLRQAIRDYNLSEHKYAHIEEPVIPAQLFEYSQADYRQVDPDTLRQAFLIEEERTLRNGIIKWEGKTYSLPAEYQGKVIIKIDPFNNTKAEVYLPDGSFLGYAQKVSKSLSDIETQERALKNKQKRLKRKEKELVSQVEEIKKELQEVKPQQEELSIELIGEKKEEDPLKNLDFLKILGGGKDE